ncbi:MAG TPA: hypothetical protein VGP09_23815 [Caballeronia sp.]|nr:hypothetical protein [Caballeronia sp.]
MSSSIPSVIRRYEAADLDAVIGVFLRPVRNVGSRDYDAAQIAARVQRLAVLHIDASITARPLFESTVSRSFGRKCWHCVASN